jgi:hypothetical protein
MQQAASLFQPAVALLFFVKRMRSSDYWKLVMCQVVPYSSVSFHELDKIVF